MLRYKLCNYYMDLSIKIQDKLVKIRVAGIIKTPNGFLFEKSDKGYIFALGGKVMLGEDSQSALLRELKEEIGMNEFKANFSFIIENFYSTSTQNVQEICFVYNIDTLFTGRIPMELVEVTKDEIEKYQIRPSQLGRILKTGINTVKHFVVKEN